MTKNDQLPPSVTDPSIAETPQGALLAYRGTIVRFLRAFGGESVDANGGANSQVSSVVGISGLLSDELQVVSDTSLSTAIDRRDLNASNSTGGDAVYSALNVVRGQASQAIGLLHDYRPAEPALAGHAYALAGYAELFLAELFCSGIPLSTLDYRGDYTPKPGSATDEVLAHAATLFDSTLKYAGDSAAVMDLARVGKARALLDLGNYAQAAASVSAVTDAYTYAAPFLSGAIAHSDSALYGLSNFVSVSDVYRGSWTGLSVADQEGLRGLDYISSGDPRTAVQNVNGSNMPVKYAPFDGASPIVLASGVEARLIEAEAVLQQGDVPTWLGKLNALRTDGTQDGSGTYNPGTGGMPGLAPLPDPDPAAAPGPTGPRVDLMFRERAFWLFLTGHRQGDLRRLIRRYGRTQAQVYPSGPYLPGGSYGSTVMLPIPKAESYNNPLFTGCASTPA